MPGPYRAFRGEAVIGTPDPRPDCLRAANQQFRGIRTFADHEELGEALFLQAAASSKTSERTQNIWVNGVIEGEPGVNRHTDGLLQSYGLV